MTRSELRTKLDQLEAFARAAFNAPTKVEYDFNAQQAVNVRNEIRAALIDSSRLTEYTLLATESERTGDRTSFDQLRTELRSATLR